MMVKAVDGSKVDVMHVLLNVNRSKLFDLLREKDILSIGYSCTLHTVQALGHFAIMTKLRLQEISDRNGADVMDLIMTNILKPWTKLCYDARKESSARKHQEDAQVIEDWMPFPVMFEAANRLYLDLRTIHHEVCVQRSRMINAKIMFKATACVVGSFYLPWWLL